MVKQLLSTIIAAFNTRIAGEYQLDNDTLYFNGKPAASLNGLKLIKVSGNRIVLEYEDGEAYLTEGGVEREASVHR
jgi:hypothetical protein